MYSQSKEEQVILEYFGSHVGTFADLGSNDGITFSNTRALAERGWTGCLIEPDPEAFDRLKKLYAKYKKLYTYNYAIGDHNGVAMLQKSSSLLHTGDTGLVSTFHPVEMDRFKSVVSYEPVEVKVYTWATARNRWSIQKFDFISIDIEGHEMSVLPQIDLTDTKLLCIEHNGSKQKKEQYLECTRKYGMDKIIYESGENIIITR
jgi:FkbM family methyltransferase